MAASLVAKWISNTLGNGNRCMRELLKRADMPGKKKKITDDTPIYILGFRK
ncbi:hypothetical protein [Sinosporangium album]|uniref:hypothetical protein n=1 Tax=Sinosporangium album TaxID=504805 RepID=UPI0015A01A52|nr:hypothetical protein [Sinosporangium album]